MGEVEKFVKKASSEVGHLSNYVEECSKKFIDCMKFYKFTPKKGKLEDVKPVDFFSVWYTFCEDYKNIWKKEQVRIQAELVKEERRKQKLKRFSESRGRGEKDLSWRYKRKDSEEEVSWICVRTTTLKFLVRLILLLMNASLVVPSGVSSSVTSVTV